MAEPMNNIVGLVELAENYDVADLSRSPSFNDLRDAFHDRMKTWVRAKDECRKLNHNRVCVVLNNVSSEGELELAAAKLGRIFREPHYHLGSAIPFEIRAGFTNMEAANGDMSVAMRQAAAALNQAKQSSKLHQVYSPQDASNFDAEADLLRKLEKALEFGEFELYYQPKMHAGFQSLMGAEALLRWHVSKSEVISPDSFIEVAERNEIIKPLTCWAVKSAVARLARWPKDLSIAVNVSPVLLLDNDLLSVVHDALDIYGVAAERLCLEVTERTMVEDKEITFRHLHQLREMGVKISIDDFGTGYSSLSHFRDLPVDEIKIDQCFVRTMLKSEKDLAIVKAVIDLAHNFSLRVVAEGVESRVVAEKLSEMRCDVLQGYFYDKPLPVKSFESHYKVMG
jgi:EAL domain-containing protein (putative c-di-GMP-specific phosphodiesterase class I)